MIHELIVFLIGATVNGIVFCGIQKLPSKHKELGISSYVAYSGLLGICILILLREEYIERTRQELPFHWTDRPNIPTTPLLPAVKPHKPLSFEEILGVDKVSILNDVTGYTSKSE